MAEHNQAARLNWCLYDTTSNQRQSYISQKETWIYYKNEEIRMATFRYLLDMVGKLYTDSPAEWLPKWSLHSNTSWYA